MCTVEPTKGDADARQWLSLSGCDAALGPVSRTCEYMAIQTMGDAQPVQSERSGTSAAGQSTGCVGARRHSALPWRVSIPFIPNLPPKQIPFALSTLFIITSCR